MFIGRQKELADLNEMYDKNHFQLFVFYGRRRVGKTWTPWSQTVPHHSFVSDANHLQMSDEEPFDCSWVYFKIFIIWW